MFKYSRLLLLFVFVALSCSKNVDPQSVQAVEQEIKIDFKYSFKNQLNTFTQKLTKDLVIDGTITIDFWLTKDEQNLILNKVSETDFFALPDSINWNDNDSLNIAISPDPGVQQLRIKYGDNDKTVYWHFINSYPDEFERINSLSMFIQKVIESKPDYQKLPKAHGAYL